MGQHAAKNSLIFQDYTRGDREALAVPGSAFPAAH